MSASGRHMSVCAICVLILLYLCSMRTHIAIYASGGDGLYCSGGDRIEQEQPPRPHHLRCHTSTVEGKRGNRIIIFTEKCTKEYMYVSSCCSLLILPYLCPHTNIYLTPSYYYYVFLHMCPRNTICVSTCYYISFVLILLYMRPHSAVCEC